MDKTRPKIIVIVGPTSSGKTSLSIELAKRFSGEVISADSRQVYKGMDLGTGKVTKSEMSGVPHFLIDVSDPKETYTAADFKKDASKAIEDIVGREHLPIVAGGTFFYIDVLLGRASLPTVSPNPSLRATLERKSAAELFSELEIKDPRRASTIDPENKRRLVRALEVVDSLGAVPEQKEVASPYDYFIIGIDISLQELTPLIKTRLVERLEAGMIAEVQSLLDNGVTYERLEDLGLEYRYVAKYIKGEIDYDQLVEELNTKIRQFAKRQLTWLKRDPEIHWFKKEDPQIEAAVVQFLKN